MRLCFIGMDFTPTSVQKLGGINADHSTTLSKKSNEKDTTHKFRAPRLASKN
jgi:hypothetical protein